MNPIEVHFGSAVESICALKKPLLMEFSNPDEFALAKDAYRAALVKILHDFDIQFPCLTCANKKPQPANCICAGDRKRLSEITNLRQHAQQMRDTLGAILGHLTQSGFPCRHPDHVVGAITALVNAKRDAQEEYLKLKKRLET